LEIAIPIITLRGDSTVWITSSLGILELQLSNYKFRLLDESTDGLPGEKYFSILRDKQGQFWIKGKLELIKYNPNTKSAVRYNAIDGIAETEGLSQPSVVTPSGEIWIAGKGGVNVFYPEQIPEVRASARPQIIKITVNDAPYDTKLSHTVIDSLDLSYSHNTVAFDFVACDYSDPGNVRFEYRLIGLDDQWVDGGQYGFARYFSLPAGSYTFEVRSSNSGGVWSESSAMVNLNILPPIWATPLAKILYFCAFIGFLLVFRNQAQRKQRRKLEIEKEKLKQERMVNDQLRKVDRLKDQFLANTSHELRTPLNGIIGLADSLIDGATGALEEATVRNLAMISNAGKRLSNLVNDILDFSKLKSHDLTLNITPVDLHAAADIVVVILGPLAKSKNIKLVNGIPKNVQLVDGDENRIQQVLYNLVGNAIKFTDQGEVELSIGEKEGFIVVNVRDTGIGIAKERYKSIFQSFEQGDGSETRQFSGTGLGLSVAKQLVELHGGTIEVKSKINYGSTFSFSLPASKISREEFKLESQSGTARIGHFVSDESMEITPEKLTPKINSNRSAHILVVDDEPVNRQVLENFLHNTGYQVTQANNGREALDLVEKHNFDLIVLDIMMPGMSGFEVCQTLRQVHQASDLPIIMLTAKNRIADLVEGFTVGANDYLAKPFSKDELLTRINTHLHLKDIHYTTGKFVPYAFLNAIGRERITDVELGDHAEVIVTVLFSDIRDFTSLSETMTPSESFKFVNNYVGKMGPIVQSHNGFVNQYLGDGIMAIFPGKPDDALQASIKMMQALEELNEIRIKEKKSPIRIGLGMHTGPLIMGIIGDEKRIEPATIADTVNTSSRLEGLTKHFKSNILISDESKNHLSDVAAFGLRYLGKVRVKGKNAPIGVYECFDGDRNESKALKKKTSAEFESALEYYNTREFHKSSLIFHSILKQNPADSTAQSFLHSCHVYEQTGPADDWEGIHDMKDK
jgi:signal transduction histidine kinase/class 3 adenylate cyclase/ActR/RegA family two-component response regulator